jgi:bifunctional N-acetylglucosamine-1-phosphate-uridyltransferase/glucosamine-1-phosphate-acetyltransferase GlmU-like protein
MQIIIPMSGKGQRFIDAGYKTPKPLIEIDGKPIIEHVVNLFPGETNFVFICNSTHLKETNMRDILTRIAPTGKILEIPPHKKGPVFAVSQIYDYINDDEEVIVNYCDFSTYWDYKDFLKHTRNRNADGAIPSYKRFHPHMLGTTNYAFMRDDKQWMLEIKEKEPFTDNRMEEYASNGTYYFKSGAIVKKYFTQLIEEDINLKGEYYVSLIYNLLKKDDLKINIYDIQHMLQWGTPQDVEEYNMWSDIFTKLSTPTTQPKNKLNIIIPMAGLGSRFAKEGYSQIKPLIEVSGKPMVKQAVETLANPDSIYLITQEQHCQSYPIETCVNKNFDNVKIIKIDGLTEGQAITANFGVEAVNDDAPFIIGACDNGMLYDQEKLNNIINTNPDMIVFTFKNYPGANANPQMYGWIKTNDQDDVIDVSVKKAISDSPEDDKGIVGAFYFKNKEVYQKLLDYLKDNDIRINNEFYIDSMAQAAIDLKMHAKSFTIDNYLCWGTPNDLKTFNYWQSFFHKCDWHPYSLEKDVLMNQDALNRLKECYCSFKQEFI